MTSFANSPTRYIGYVSNLAQMFKHHRLQEVQLENAQTALKQVTGCPGADVSRKFYLEKNVVKHCNPAGLQLATTPSRLGYFHSPRSLPQHPRSYL
ncbi:hypothetical protein QCA50_012430 [Cerrena zonata]|uniref:Uncharacterized protein n=1 Tax=Cerrena zonata TaxID=2478898 RepID=A0AAW0G3H3_9APHY